MKLKIQKNRDENPPETPEHNDGGRGKEIPINSPAHKIEQIKSELVSCTTSPELCEAEVIDMWDEIESSK